MYTIKTKKDNLVSTISYHANYKNATRKNHKFTNCLGHGNDLAYYNGNLYVAPCDFYVEVINTKTWSHSRLYSERYVSAIAHYGGNKFIICGGSGKDSVNYNYTIVEIQGNRLVPMSSWIVNNPKAAKGFRISQAMTYYKKNKKLYLILSKTDYKSNIILRSSIGSSTPDYCFTSKTSNKKYELEGIDFNKDGKKIIGSNVAGGDFTFIS